MVFGAHLQCTAPEQPTSHDNFDIWGFPHVGQGFEHNLLSDKELKRRLGTNFYNIALHTKGGILLHPGKLVRAMIDTLPENVNLYENSSLLDWKKKKDAVICKFKNGSIKFTFLLL